MNDDLLPIFGTIEIATRDEDIDRHPVHIGADEDVAVCDAQHTNKFSMLAFEHLHNLTFGFAVVTFGEHGHAHAVAMQGLVGVLGGDEDVFAFAVVAHHVGLARRLHLDRTLDIFRLRPELRHTLWTHHIAVGTHLLQQAFVF